MVNIKFCAVLLACSILFSCSKDDVTSGTPSTTTTNNNNNSNDSTFSRLTLHISTFQNSNGQLIGALFNSSSGFSSNSIFKSIYSPLTGTSLDIAFDSVPSGNYAFSCFHDANADGTLNTNGFGLPVEGYGFSNNPGITLGLPSWSSIQFTVSGNDTIHQDISLIYL